jgi:hypothetical protein
VRCGRGPAALPHRPPHSPDSHAFISAPEAEHLPVLGELEAVDPLRQAIDHSGRFVVVESPDADMVLPADRP